MALLFIVERIYGYSCTSVKLLMAFSWICTINRENYPHLSCGFAPDILTLSLLSRSFHLPDPPFGFRCIPSEAGQYRVGCPSAVISLVPAPLLPQAWKLARNTSASRPCAHLSTPALAPNSPPEAVCDFFPVQSRACAQSIGQGLRTCRAAANNNAAGETGVHGSHIALPFACAIVFGAHPRARARARTWRDTIPLSPPFASSTSPQLRSRQWWTSAIVELASRRYHVEPTTKAEGSSETSACFYASVYRRGSARDGGGRRSTIEYAIRLEADISGTGST